MKIIEALKKIKVLLEKADDIKRKIRDHCAISNIESQVYDDQRQKVRDWLQSHSDILKEVLRLRIAIQRTNLETQVDVDLNGVTVTKSIAEWIHRRRDLAGNELSVWSQLTDRNIREGKAKGPTGDDIDVKVIRFYDPEKRDQKRDLFMSEPKLVDARLEVANAVTDLIE